MKLYRKYYRIIGLVIGVIGGVLTPFVPFLIKNKSVPDDMNIYVLLLVRVFGLSVFSSFGLAS